MNIKLRMKGAFFILSIAIFALLILNDGQTANADKNTLSPGQSAYAPGQLIVKLKKDKTSVGIQGLNAKYNVSSMEKIFKELPFSPDALTELKEKLAHKSAEHQSWYWQLDKDSREYQDYLAKIEKEKEELQKQIKAKEDLIAHLEERKKRAPNDGVSIDLDNVYLLKTDKDTDILMMTKDYKINPAVEYAEPDYMAKAQMVPDDPYYSSYGSWGQSYDDLWGLKKIKAAQAWDISQGKGVIVAVIDTGIDYNHEDIADNIWTNSGEIPDNNIDDDKNGYIDDIKGYDFAYDDSDPVDKGGHGTHVAGIIAAAGNNNKGIIGVAPKARVMAVQGVLSFGSGFYSSLAEGLKYAADNGADVINNSWGGYESSSLIKDAIDYAYSQGCAIIAAAGNESTDVRYCYPASLANVIAVASVDRNDKKSDFSNYGHKIDVAAPGGDSEDAADHMRKYQNILSLRAGETNLYFSDDEKNIVDTNYYRARGTSMACPYVSGLAALILAKNGSFSAEELRQVIRASAKDGEANTSFNTETGFGRINAYRALQIKSVCKLKIDSPDDNDMLNTGGIKIKGSAGGKNFKSYKLEYTASADTKWLPIGSAVYSPVTKDTLAIWDVRSTGEYYLKLTVTDTSNNNFEVLGGPIFITQGKLHKGWPRYVTAPTIEDTTVFLAADVDNNGKKEIVLGGYYDNLVHIFKDDGSYLKGWPVNIDDNVESDIVCADVDGDGDLEIFFCGYNQYVYGYHHNGLPVSGWPQSIYADDYAYGNSFYTMAVADVDHNGTQEIIITSNYNNSIHIYEGDGTLFSSWSIGEEPFGGPVIADMDNNGTLEIIVLTGYDVNYNTHIENYDCYLFIFDYQGNVLHKLNIDDTSVIFDSSLSYPVVGDLDKDGDLEIVLARAYQNNQGVYAGRLFVWSYDNDRYTNTVSKDIKGAGVSQLALADMDNDEDLEIVCLTAQLDSEGKEHKYSYAKIFNYDGSIFWQSANSAKFSSFTGSPAIGDIDGDGKKEIIALDTVKDRAKNYQSLYVYEVKSAGYLRYDMFGRKTAAHMSSPSITDLDNDGRVEVVSFNPINGLLAVWDFSGKYNAKTNDWPMFRHDIYRSGNYDYGNSSDSAAPTGSITINMDSSRAKSIRVKLNLRASDDIGVTGCYFSVNPTKPAVSAKGWKSMSSTKSYEKGVVYILSKGNGAKTIYCWYKDAAGNISDTYSDLIILDVTEN